MNIHEFQAKKILEKFQIPIPKFMVIKNLAEVENVIKEMELKEAVVKVQVHAGGRGKAGGVKLARSPEEILEVCKKLLHMRIVNQQTGKEGVIANQLLISTLVNYTKEFYLGIVLDREQGEIVIIVSPEGGVEIEEIALKLPEKILKMTVPEKGKLRAFQIYGICKFMNWNTPKLLEQAKNILTNLVDAFIETDAMLLEVNPLVLTNEGDLVALDAKLSVDDNALFRQPEILSFYDPSQYSINEVSAQSHDLAYVALDGEIGCMVNGAGLAMATMDIIDYYGAAPANFLDVGGGASEDKVAEGFKIILSDPSVKAILVNIFGGIMNCETLASGIVSAANQLKVTVPLIVRMEGTNVEEGKRKLAESGLNIQIANNLSDAAQLVVASSKS